MAVTAFGIYHFMFIFIVFLHQHEAMFVCLMFDGYIFGQKVAYYDELTSLVRK